MPFAAAISTHPVSSLATGEAIGQVLEELGELGERPDVAFVFVTPGHAGALEDIGGAVRSILRPTVLLGAVGDRVLGADLSTFGPGVTLLAAHIGPVAALVWSRQGPDPAAPPGVPLTGPVVAVGHTGVSTDHPHIGASATVVGGCVRHWPLLLDDRLVTDGAVGVGFGPSAGATAVVAAGFRPFGPPLVVTQTNGPAVVTLSGQPAYACLREMARDALPASDLHLVDRELYLGPPAPPDSTTHPVGAGLRRVLGAEPAAAALVLGEPIEEGSAVRFYIRDPDGTEAELWRAVIGSDAAGAVLFPRLPATGPDRAATGVATAVHPVPPTAGLSPTVMTGPSAGILFSAGPPVGTVAT